MLYAIIYGLQIVDFLRNALSAVTIITVILTFGALITATEYQKDTKDYKELLQTATKLFIVTLISGFFLITIPTKETGYQLAAIYIGKQLNNQYNINEKLYKISEIIDMELDELKKSPADRHYERAVVRQQIRDLHRKN